MNDFLQFLLKNWQLSSLFVVLLLVYIILEWREKSTGSNKISPQQLTSMINHDKAVVIDIREKESFHEGHIVGAITCPSGEFDDKLKKLKKYIKQPVVVVDANGQKVMPIIQKLRQNGFEKVFTLKGGINSWSQAEFPLKKG